jgi:hypothetical protein
MRLCPYCKQEVGGLRVGDDDCISYCGECERVIEGEEIEELEKQNNEWWLSIDSDQEWINQQLGNDNG